MDGDKEILPCYAYRDDERGLVAPKVHEIVDFSTLYSRTGIEFNTFNTIYGLYAEKLSGRIENATDFLLLPEYFTYKLTGKKVKEYTMCTTTGLVNATTHEFDNEIIDKLSLKKELFGKIEQAGFTVGGFTDKIKDEVGGDIPVVLCASHDTASAVVAIDMDENSPYISSGTWSLVGIKTDKAITDKGENMSNEGGINNTFRHQKNIMGMWLINNLKNCLSVSLTFDEMDKMAIESDYKEIFDVNDERFFAPDNMKDAILSYLSEYGKVAPKTEGDIISSVYHSLAYGYAKTCELIENNTGKTYDKIYIVGGGAKNTYLNELTERYSGKKVIALPIEATALGNLKIQMSK
jgi:rhamnulokinase